MAGPSEKRGRGRPIGSTKKVTVMSQINSLLNRPQDVPAKRSRGRPRLIRLPAVDLPKAKVSEGPRNQIAGQDSRKASIRKAGLLRLRKSADKDMMVVEKRVGPHPLVKIEKAVNVPIASVRYQSPTHHTSMMKKYTHEKVNKQLKTSLQSLGTKRGRGRPRKDSSTIARKPTDLAAITVVVEELKRGRGRPRKAQPKKRDQVARFNHEIWNGSVQYGQYQDMDLFPSSTGFLNSYRQRNPTEMAVGLADTDPLQVRQEARSPSLDLQGGWVSREWMNKEEDLPSWETKPLAPEWSPETAECADNTLDDNSMSQWVVEDSTVSQVSQSQYLGELAPEQLDYQEELLKELADFKSQLKNELAATRAEIREGAQMMRSAISGVSAEIHRLGQILQPLVNAITAGNLSQQGHPVAFEPRPPQDTPPDDSVNFTQPSAHSKTSFSHQNTVFAHPHKLPNDGPTEEVSSVKMEDAKDSLQSCNHQAQSALSTQVDSPTAPTMLGPHQLNLCPSKSTSSSVTPNSSTSIPQPNRNTFGGQQRDKPPGLSSISSFLEAPSTKSSQSSPPALPVDCATNSSGSEASSSASSSNDSSCQASTIVAPPVDPCSYKPIKV
ncbi:uncharacterized protein LOC143985310 [Lithobates pipiens]